MKRIRWMEDTTLVHTFHFTSWVSNDIFSRLAESRPCNWLRVGDRKLSLPHSNVLFRGGPTTAVRQDQKTEEIPLHFLKSGYHFSNGKLLTKCGKILCCLDNITWEIWADPDQVLIRGEILARFLINRLFGVHYIFLIDFWKCDLLKFNCTKNRLKPFIYVSL